MKSGCLLSSIGIVYRTNYFEPVTHEVMKMAVKVGASTTQGPAVFEAAELGQDYFGYNLVSLEVDRICVFQPVSIVSGY